MAPPRERRARFAAATLFREALDLARRLHPESDEELLFYRKYGIAKQFCPDNFIPCHACMQNDASDDPCYVLISAVETHQARLHPKATVKCPNKCPVKFLSEGEAGKHHHFVHVLQSVAGGTVVPDFPSSPNIFLRRFVQRL
ncbi:hypothetical protein ACP70R_021542 [Stipagrostis hirtigluma subsp. patula]